ncbi:MAG: alkaline phosphatase D [Paraglaciecola psychrophila]|jgi:alkaline phosphatase D
MTVSRRRFIGAAAAATVVAPGLVACAGAGIGAAVDSEFAHGVASGDPLQDRVIIWTRVSTSAATAEVSWQLATDRHFERLVASGTLITEASRDYTVKVDVTGLSSDTRYFYRFSSHNAVSMTGRTRTLPAGKPESFALGVVSCSNYPMGYFNVYRALAERDDIDVVLHLGDYIYEYANKTYGDGTALGRIPVPDHECIELQDYRQRYGCYRGDEDLIAVHARHPFILVWDDHEFANNAWIKGAENHSEEEGSWAQRREAATQAYFEWMPIREAVSDRQNRLYRSFQVGDLFDLIMLDTRIIGRDQQLEKDQDWSGQQRSLLGVQQEHWLQGELSASFENKTLWRVLGQQVVMAQVMGADGRPLSGDFWDGYPASRQRLLAQFEQQANSNNVILTGDVHSSWGSDICQSPFSTTGEQAYNSATGEGALAVEFVAPAVSSPALPSQEKADESAGQLMQAHPHIKYVELFRRGYMVVQIDRTAVSNSWYHIDTISERSTAQQRAKKLQLQLNKPGLIEV